MHTHCQVKKKKKKVAPWCPWISCSLGKVGPACTTAASFWCLLAMRSKMVTSYWFRWQAPIFASILVLYMLWYGLSALVAWLGSDKLILVVWLWRFEWRGFCGHRALRSLIWSDLILRQLSCEWSLWVQLKVFYSCPSKRRLTLGRVLLWIISSSFRLTSQQLSLWDFYFWSFRCCLFTSAATASFFL